MPDAVPTTHGGPSTEPDGFVPHPRAISWVGASALALGGSNQSLFLIGALLVAQGTMAVPLLALGLVLSYMATPGWIELSCMFPDRVGGIAATCAEAFRPYSAVLANLTGVCYWWGWVPTCGLTAIVSAQAIHQWYLPHAPVRLLATLIVVIFAAVNLCGLKWAVRVARPIAGFAFVLALCSGLIPVIFGHVDWHRSFDFHLNSPFGGAFGHLTSVMTGLYLIGFAAPALEAAACHIGEMKDPDVDQPKAMWISGGMASVFFVLLPVVWLGMFRAAPLEGDLAGVIGPTFAPVLGSLAKAAAVGFVVLNMSCGTLQPLSGASRTLSQLSEDGLLPRIVGFRSRRTDAPVVAILVTATAAVIFLVAGDPIPLVAAANLTYLIGIALPSVAVWLLRRNDPGRPRTYRARDSSIFLGMVAAVVWLLATILGFAQFGLPIVTFGLALAFSGSLAYAWRAHGDRKRSGGRVPERSIYLKLTGAMLLVLVLDGAGYTATVDLVGSGNDALMAALRDIFVVIGLLTISVGLVLPGMIAHSMARMEEDVLGLTRARRVLDHTVGELTGERAELATLVEKRSAALGAAHEEIEHARRRRHEMHRRLHELATLLGATHGDGSDPSSTPADFASIVGRILDVDVVAIYTASDLGGFDDVPVVWHPGRIQGADDGRLTLTPDSRRFVDDVADQAETHALPGRSDHGLTPTTGDGPAFPCGTGYSAWVLAPAHAADGRPLALVAVGLIDPVPEWNQDDVALIESVTAELGRSIVQARLHRRQVDLVHRLEDIDRARSEFLSTFSHELRTPLTSIRAYTELLRDGGETDGDQDRMLGVIETNSVRLSNLIEDILTLSHVNSAVDDVQMVPVDMVPVINSICESMAPIAEANGLRLTARAGQCPAQVLGDRNRLERLLFNLVANAVKFTPPDGHILISTSGSATSVDISVSDTGIGIPVHEQEAVFGRFFRGAEATRDVIPGSGLGLAIVRAIVDHHDGTVSLDSVPGRGTTVVVRLPSLAAARSRCELEAQGGARPADTEREDLTPAGVGSSRGGSDATVPTLHPEAHTKELQS